MRVLGLVLFFPGMMNSQRTCELAVFCYVCESRKKNNLCNESVQERGGKERKKFKKAENSFRLQK